MIQTTSVTFVSIDNTPIHEQNRKQTEKASHLLRSVLRTDKSDWRIVFGHHPCFSGGRHRPDKELINKILPIMRDGGVDIYLAGHDHNMQHWRDEQSVMDHFVSGNGGRSMVGYEKRSKNVNRSIRKGG